MLKHTVNKDDEKKNKQPLKQFVEKLKDRAAEEMLI